ncbi:hypothetical protein TWF481_002687 [Arthrobotrys musiformis]|uniref:Retroviral polymerase SH3-like domain-containing protein n=1 Tax=Arthrobotrys musiformis TaxID=47236 RepID=A0AAV9VR28_9PEZI
MPKELRHGKFNSRAIPAIFIGYVETSTTLYKVYDGTTAKVVKDLDWEEEEFPGLKGLQGQVSAEYDPRQTKKAEEYKSQRTITGQGESSTEQLAGETSSVDLSNRLPSIPAIERADLINRLPSSPVTIPAQAVGGSEKTPACELQQRSAITYPEQIQEETILQSKTPTSSAIGTGQGEHEENLHRKTSSPSARTGQSEREEILDTQRFFCGVPGNVFSVGSGEHMTFGPLAVSLTIKNSSTDLTKQCPTRIKPGGGVRNACIFGLGCILRVCFRFLLDLGCSASGRHEFPLGIWSSV